MTTTINQSISLDTLRKFSNGVEDMNQNGVFDEGDVLFGYEQESEVKIGGGGKDGAKYRRKLKPKAYTLTEKDTESQKSLEDFLSTALMRKVSFFTSRFEEITSQDACYMGISDQELEYYGSPDTTLTLIYRIRDYDQKTKSYSEQDHLLFSLYSSGTEKRKTPLSPACQENANFFSYGYFAGGATFMDFKVFDLHCE
jgi:hypothetical protein